MDSAVNAEDYSPIVGYGAAIGNIDGMRQFGAGPSGEIDQRVYQCPPAEGTQGKLPVGAELVASIALRLRTRAQDSSLRRIRNQASELETDITIARACESYEAAVTGHVRITELICVR